MVPLEGIGEDKTREELLDEVERLTGSRPDIKQAMLNLLDDVRVLVESGDVLAVDGIDIILCNVETRLMRRAVAGLVLKDRPRMGVSAYAADEDPADPHVHNGTGTLQ